VIKRARAWGLYGAEEKYSYIWCVIGGNVKERDYFSDLEVDGRIILR
jgi:hypothetical protein